MPTGHDLETVCLTVVALAVLGFYALALAVPLLLLWLEERRDGDGRR
jgi:hypothetical protein